jgi:hypothetical protein
MLQGESFELFLNTMAKSMMSYAVLISNTDGSLYCSGTAIINDGDACILTAKHCLIDIDITKGVRIVSSSYSAGVLLLSPKYCYLEDVDVGFIYLSSEQIAQLKILPRRITTINSNTAGPGTEAYFFGFPSSIVNVQGNVIHPTPLYYRTIVSERWPSEEEFDHHSKKDTFFLEWEENNTVDISGTTMPAIRLKGISGAGVFITKLENDSSVLWDFTDLQLAGIVSSVNIGAKLIRCTRSEYALKFYGAALDIR